MAANTEVAALYQQRIRELSASVRADRRLDSPEVSVTRRSRICGSMVTLDVDFDGERIERVGFRVRACSLGMASTAILVDAGPGQNVAQLARAGAALADLLAGEPAEFDESWQALEILTAAIPFPTRHNSVLLPFETAAEAFKARAGRPPHRGGSRRPH